MKRARAPFQSPKPKIAKKKKDNTVAMYKNISTNVRLIRRNADQGDIICIFSQTTLGSYNFRLSNVPASTEFTSLFDQYKINAVSLTFYPQQTEVDTHVSPAVQNVRIFTAIDYNDNDIPANIDALRQYDNVEVHPITEKFSVYIANPRFADTTGAVRTGYINTSSPSTLHFGLKYGVEVVSPGASGTYTFKVEAVYYFSFKNAK